MAASHTGSTVVLRPWRPSDREALAGLANDRRISINLRDGFPYPYAVEDADRFIAMAQGVEPQTHSAIEASGQLAGGIGYTLHTDVERQAASDSGIFTTLWPQLVRTAAALVAETLVLPRAGA